MHLVQKPGKDIWGMGFQLIVMNKMERRARGGSEVSRKAKNFFRPKMQTQLSENPTEVILIEYIKLIHFQPMIQYINHKDIYGPFSKKADVYLPHSAEVTSAKYTNM